MKIIEPDPSVVSRQAIKIAEPGQPTLALQVQRARVAATEAGDAIYVHGATFGADLSIFYRFDGRSWADEVNQIGVAAWDSLCLDADADYLLAALGSRHKLDAQIERGTHLLHLESQRTALHARVNLFLQGVMK